jgi:hypothetical protein
MCDHQVNATSEESKHAIVEEVKANTPLVKTALVRIVFPTWQRWEITLSLGLS